MKFMEVPEIWIKVNSVSPYNIQLAEKITEKIYGDVPVILFSDFPRERHKIKKSTSFNALDVLKEHFGQDNVKERKSVQIMDKDQVLFTEVAVIKQYGFTAMEAIEILKLAELRELNAQLRDTVYISGEVTACPGRVE